MDIAEWLETLGLGEYARAFADNHIDFAVLGELTDGDLKELGITSLGHRKRLLAGIAVRSAPQASARPAATEAAERRQVTILFADLSNFTALSRSLDPEELRELVGKFTALVDGVIVDYGGTVDKHIGDAVMALFGAPIAHDDDPLRAARAALEIHEALRRWRETAAVAVQAHIGIASGEVVAGTIDRAGTRDYTVLGESVNLAARLVAAAGSGETLISDDVHHALAGRASADSLGEMRFKGIEAPLRVWRLRAMAGETSGSRSPFVGRDAELGQFKGILANARARRRGHVVYVRGEAGIGKTRLAEEMRRMAEGEGFVSHRSLVLDFGVGKGQDPIRALLRDLLGLSSTSSTAEREAAADRAVAEGRIAAEHRVFLDDLLDLAQRGEWRTLYDAMDNAARNRGKRAVAASLAAHACRRHAVMLMVEDLHWADPQVLGHLAAIAAAIADGPGLLVMTSRVEGDPIDAAWRASCRSTSFATIDLGPLRPEEATLLASSYLDATQRLALACIDRASGNPLFLEQLLRNAEEGREDTIPASIQSLVLARMDRLTPVDRQAFQAASVIGQRFSLELLRRLTGMPDYVCEGLVVHALVLPEGEDFLFAHALIQEGAYSSLLKARRRDLHRMAADWFAGQDPVLSAQHLDRAEDDRAPAAYLAAAQAQRAAYHAEAALRLVERGREIVRDNKDAHALVCLKGELERDLGDITASIATFRQAVAAAPDEVSLSQAQLGLAEGLRVSEGLAEALALLDAAQQAAECHDLVAELARLHHLRGNIFFPLGKIEGCAAEHKRSLAYARRSNSPEAEARSLGGLGDAAYAQGRMRTAVEHFSRCVALSREHGFGRIEVANRSMVGFSRVYLNELREAREDGAACARAAALVGQPRAEMLGETMQVFACYELGAYDEMKVHLDREMRLIRLLGARRFEAQNLKLNGRLLLATGQRAEAEASLRAALAICRSAGMGFCGPSVISALSWAVEEPAERDGLLAEGEALLRQGSLAHNHFWFYRDAIDAMIAAQDWAGARRYADALEAYSAAEPLPWSALFIARGRALAAALEAGANAARAELQRIHGALRAAEFRTYLPAVEAALAG